MRVPLLLLSFPAFIYAWGADGHRVIGSIANKYLSKIASNQVESLLGTSDLSTVATWADSVKHTSAYRWSSKLHFINTPDWECGFSPVSDCAGNRCLSGAISNYTQRLESQYSDDDREEALKFLVHFVGDIHQPLHVGVSFQLQISLD